MVEKIGVIGLGNIGKPLFEALKYYHENVVGFDKFKKSDNWIDILKTEVVFICVPTAMKSSSRYIAAGLIAALLKMMSGKVVEEKPKETAEVVEIDT